MTPKTATTAEDQKTRALAKFVEARRKRKASEDVTKKLRAAENALFADALNAGATYKEIADQLGIGQPTVWRSYAKRLERHTTVGVKDPAP